MEYSNIVIDRNNNILNDLQCKNESSWNNIHKNLKHIRFHRLRKQKNINPDSN